MPEQGTTTVTLLRGRYAVVAGLSLPLMSQTLSLSLQAFPAPDKDKESLQYLIQRVNAQRGSFRNVTEQSLEDEIRESEAAGDSSNHGTPTNQQADPGHGKIEKEEVAKAREEIMKQTAQALAETSTALEFVSLVLSKHAPAAAQTTMSPFLKQSVPLGSLGAELVQAPHISELEKHNDEMMGIGWRMKSLNGAADSLLKSASRLEEEMGKETRYWEQVLAIKEKGWSLHRLPREKHTLGVRYGFGEAYTDFRDRGLAALRRDKDGNLSLDRGLRWKGDRKLRVRVLDRGKPIASNVGSTSTTTTEDTSVEREILNARDSIYDEELHHELDREARSLVNQGVRCVNGSILLPYDFTRQIEISLVPADEEASGHLDKENLGQDVVGVIPEVIAIAFRTLLSHAHRQNLQRRSTMPPPLREKKVPRPMYALIKPVLEFLQHRSQAESTQACLDELGDTLKAAGVRFFIERTSSRDFHQLQNLRGQSNISAVGNLLQTITTPPHTSWTLTYPDQSITITVDIHTALQPPHFGTTFQTATKGLAEEHIPISFPKAELSASTDTFQTHLFHVLALAIQQILLSSFSSWQFASAHDHSLVRKRAKGQGPDMVYLALNKDRFDLGWRSGQAGEQALWTWVAADLNASGEKSNLIDVFKQI